MKASVLRSEIHDLQSLLQGLPANLQAGPAFASYRLRLDKLQDDLAVARLKQRLTWVRIGLLIAFLITFGRILIERTEARTSWLSLASDGLLLTLFVLLSGGIKLALAGRREPELPVRH